VSEDISLSGKAVIGQTVNSPEIQSLRSVVKAFPADVDLHSEPIPPEWIISGAPQARVQRLVRTRDRSGSVVVWDCTAGSFEWHYVQDETLLVVSGEAFLQLPDGQERCFGPGDVGFFPAGTICKWRVAEYIRKVAVLKESMWPPFGYCLMQWNKLVRAVGLTRRTRI
jgi:uncharacterized protein